MKQIMPILLWIIIALTAVMTGCSKSDSDSVIPGYLPPGDFRPQGIAREKAYSFSDPTIARSCAADDSCMAVYGLWLTGTSYTSSVPVPGFALDDTHEIISGAASSITFSVKMMSFAGTWSISMIIDGVQYTGTTPESSVTLSDLTSADDTMPACDTTTLPLPCLSAFAASGVKLRLRRIVFNAPVTLTSVPETNAYILGGDYIVAQSYSL